MILVRELSVGTVSVDTEAMTFTVNGGPTGPVRAAWVGWVREQEAHDVAAAESAQIAATIAAGISDLEAAQDVAASDVADSETRAGQADQLVSAAEARVSVITGWTPQAASAATSLPQLQARVLADLHAVRGEVAALHDRDRIILTAISESYTARALHGRGISLAYRALIGLARIVSGRLT